MFGKDLLSMSVAEFGKFVREKEAADVVLKKCHMMFAQASHASHRYIKTSVARLKPSTFV